MRYTKQQIKEKFQILPSSVQDIILSAEVANAIKAIAQKNGLHMDMAGILNEEITYVMVGVEKSTDFIRNLKTQLHLPEDKANAIAGDVNDQIFLPIREALKKIADKSMQDVQKEETPTSSSLHEKEAELEGIDVNVPLSESDIIRQQIKDQQEVGRHTAPPPENLPAQKEVVQESAEETTVPQNVDKKERHIEKQNPYARDPYREPTN